MQERDKPTPLVIMPDRIGSQPNRQVTGIGKAPNRLGRIAVATGITAAALGLLEAIGYFLPKVE